MKYSITFILIYVSCLRVSSQIVNYVSNGGFENHYECNYPNVVLKVKGWSSVDSSTGLASYQSRCLGINTVPLNGFTYQEPRSGDSYVITTFFCEPPSCSPQSNRSYLRNRLASNLESGRTYCVVFHVNISGNSTYGMDNFGIYFADNAIDTISKSTIPLTYINPQIQNINNNIVTDTLNWISISGSFVANGNEKFLLLGNFKSDPLTNRIMINPTNLPAVFTDVCIDDVSCIDIDLPAFAGADTFFIPGSSLYLGRERDVGIDEACTWYQLPNMATALDTAAGIWVTPVGTSTYVVRQEICGNVKWDTVVVRESPLGVEDLRLNSQRLKLWPQPAKEELVLQLDNYSGSAEIFIFNNLGIMVRREDLIFKDNRTLVRVSDLEQGVYFLELRTKDLRLRDKLLIER